MFWKKSGLVCIVLAALAIVSYAQTSKPKARSANLQAASGYLGVGVQDLSPEEAKALKLGDISGAKVTDVTPDEAGARVGIHVNDVILEINGKKVGGQEFQDTIVGLSPGAKVNLVVLRNGVKQNMMAVLGTRPAGLPLRSGSEQPVTVQTPFGPMQFGPMSPEDLRAMATGNAPRALFDGEGLGAQLAAFFGVQEGVLVQMVYEKSAADRAGLKAGDVVIKVNGMPVASVREISGVVRQANKKIVVFTVVRNKKEITLNVEVAWNRADPSDRDSVN